MPQDFISALTKHGISYEIRSNGNQEPDVMTLSDGSKVRLVDCVIIKRYVKGKKIQSFGYSVVTARRIR